MQHDVNEAEVLAPTDDALQAVLHEIITRTMKVLTRRGALRCGADGRQAREQLCSYITRPALANERVQCNTAW